MSLPATPQLDLEAILKDFDPKSREQNAKLHDRKIVSHWLSGKDRARYDRLQKMSERRFGKKVREVILLMIDLAEKRAA